MFFVGAASADWSDVLARSVSSLIEKGFIGPPPKKAFLFLRLALALEVGAVCPLVGLDVLELATLPAGSV
jgi:hypothetical protein